MAWLFHVYPSLHAFDQSLKTPYLPVAMLDQGKKGKIMKQLGLVYAEMNDEQRYLKNDDSNVVLEDSTLNLFQRKRRVGDYLYRANIGGKYNFPSQLSLGDDVKKSIIPQLSLAISSLALYDDNFGTLVNPEGSGKEWERPATLSIYNKGKLDEAHNVGFRLLGEKGERKSRWQRNQDDTEKLLDQSYQVYFRSKYSIDNISGDKVFDDSNAPTLSSLVVKRGDAIKQVLAYDLWRIAGISVPFYGVAFLNVNGNDMGLRLIHEPVNRKQWLAREGKPHLDFYRNGQGPSDSGWHWNVEMNFWYKKVRSTLNMELAKTYIDLDALTKSIALRMFCGSSDWSQWAIVRDRHSLNRWRWIDWGMETCFSDQWSTSEESIAEQDWLSVVMSKDIDNKKWRVTHHNLRTMMFVELMNNDPAYQQYFLSILERMMQEFSGVNKYRETIHQFEIEFAGKGRRHTGDQEYLSLKKLREFIEKRHLFIKQQIERTFNIQH